jgi:hypothetical protein
MILNDLAPVLVFIGVALTISVCDWIDRRK